MKILSRAKAGKKNKKAEAFQISYIYWLFLNDVMAVKGLNWGILPQEQKMSIFLPVLAFSFNFSWGKKSELQEESVIYSFSWKDSLSL